MKPAPYSIRELNGSDRFTEALKGVFENSPWIAEGAAALRPFDSLASLHRAMVSLVRSADESKQLGLIREHPDLVGTLARNGSLTRESASEQADAGLTRLTPEEVAAFESYNASYREKFGFPFVICARLNKKEAILEAFPRRLAHDPAAERATALDEIYKIALFRLRDLIRVGQLTTHVLDTANGKPAANLAITLRQSGCSAPLTETVTNAKGRTDEPLFAGDEFAEGSYEISFDVGRYFGNEKSFLEIVPVRFRIMDCSEHYHVPLLVSPYSYSTYRGS